MGELMKKIAQSLEVIRLWLAGLVAGREMTELEAFRQTKMALDGLRHENAVLIATLQVSEGSQDILQEDHKQELLEAQCIIERLRKAVRQVGDWQSSVELNLELAIQLACDLTYKSNEFAFAVRYMPPLSRFVRPLSRPKAATVAAAAN